MLVLKFVASFTEANGYAPTLREIGDYTNISSTNGVNDHLNALTRRGLIRRFAMRSRCLLVTDAGHELLGGGKKKSSAARQVTVFEPGVCSRESCGAMAFSEFCWPCMLLGYMSPVRFAFGTLEEYRADIKGKQAELDALEKQYARQPGASSQARPELAAGGHK